MRPILAPNNNGGFSLIELMVALALIAVVFLGLTDTSIVAVDYSMNNQIREEAVRIADETMDLARNTPFATLSSTASPIHIFRNIRGRSVDYSVSRTVTVLDGNNTQVAVRVDWPSKRWTSGRWAPTTRNHQIVSVVSAGTGIR